MPHRRPNPELVRQMERVRQREALEGANAATLAAPPGDPNTRPGAPAWCRSFYRPRQLSEQGVRVMRDLDPAGHGTTFPLGYGDPNRDLVSRLEFLARRHTALDLVRKGQAFSAGGYYAHISRQKDAQKLLVEWYDSMPRGGPMLAREELTQWLALFRRPSLEQVLALSPRAARETWDELDGMAGEGLLEMAHVQMGAGMLETVSLTKKGWRGVMDSHPGAKASGWGPRAPLPQNREFHEQVVGDAAAYALHELTLRDSTPTGVLLDPALRRLYLGEPFIPDLRLDYTDALGIGGHYLMEVEGKGDDYRGSRHRAKMASAGLFRCFSTKGVSAGGNSVSITR